MKIKILYKNQLAATFVEFLLAGGILTAVFIAGGIIYRNATEARFEESMNAISESITEPSTKPDEYTGLCSEKYTDGGTDQLGLSDEVCF